MSGDSGGVFAGPSERSASVAARHYALAQEGQNVKVLAVPVPIVSRYQIRENRKAAPAQNRARAVPVAASERPRRSGVLPADDWTLRRLTNRSHANEEASANTAAKAYPKVMMACGSIRRLSPRIVGASRLGHVVVSERHGRRLRAQSRRGSARI